MAKNIFDKSKKPKKSKKDDEKIIISVQGKDFDEKLIEFNSLREKTKQLEKDLAISQEIIKEVGVNEYIKLIEIKQVNTGTFIVESDSGEKIMVLPMKKYIKIGESEAENLCEMYGENIVTENTKYSFNSTVLENNIDILSDLIQNSNLSDKDKENLIEAKTTYTIEKDALDKVYILSNKSENSVAKVLEDLQPVIQLKNIK